MVSLVAAFTLTGCRNVLPFEENPAAQPPVPGASIPPPSVTPITYDLSKRPVPLTDSQKELVLNIALGTPEAKSEPETGLSYRVEWGWGALLLEEDPTATTTIGLAGTWWGLDYEIINTGVPSFVNPHAVIYPNVRLRFGDPLQWTVQVTVDLATSQAVYVDKNPTKEPIQITIPTPPSP